MTVRKVKRTNPKTGEVHEFWMIDICPNIVGQEQKRIRKKAVSQTKRGAEAEERQIRFDLANGSYERKEEPKEVPTLAKFQKEFIENYAVPNNKLSEVDAKKSIFKHHLIPSFGAKQLNQINEKAIEQFKAQKLKEKKKNGTVNNILSVLRKTLTTAKEWKYIDRVPNFKWLNTPPPNTSYFSRTEIDRLVEAADPEVRPMITFVVNTALRLGEVRALHWTDVNFDDGFITIRHNLYKMQLVDPKNGQSREIPLNSTALKVLENLERKGPYVFCDENGKALTKESLKHPLWRACKKAGLSKVGWHRLRHACASNLAEAGAGPRAIQAVLGHSTMKMTDRYTHISQRAVRDAVKKLDGNQRQHDGNTKE